MTRRRVLTESQRRRLKPLLQQLWLMSMNNREDNLVLIIIKLIYGPNMMVENLW